MFARASRLFPMPPDPALGETPARKASLPADLSQHEAQYQLFLQQQQLYQTQKLQQLQQQQQQLQQQLQQAQQQTTSPQHATRGAAPRAPASKKRASEPTISVSKY
jgi:hypothetical protein